MGFIHFIREKKVILIGLTSVLIVISLILYVLIGGRYGIRDMGNKASPIATMPDYPQSKKVTDNGGVSYSPSAENDDIGAEFSKKIIKRGNVSIDVGQSDFLKSFSGIQALAKSFGGYVKDASYTTLKNNYSGSISVMVPQDKFDVFLNSLERFGKIENISVSAEDVSGEYVDLESRLKVLETQRTLLLSWLDEAKTISDMLNIRSQLQNVETQIETIKGRMKYIDFHSSYSEVYINLNRARQISFISSYLSDMLNRAGRGIVYSFGFFILLIAYLTPYIILLIVIYLVWKRKHAK